MLRIFIIRNIEEVGLTLLQLIPVGTLSSTRKYGLGSSRCLLLFPTVRGLSGSAAQLAIHAGCSHLVPAGGQAATFSNLGKEGDHCSIKFHFICFLAALRPVAGTKKIEDLKKSQLAGPRAG
jgi:hypothetical protein